MNGFNKCCISNVVGEIDVDMLWNGSAEVGDVRSECKEDEGTDLRLIVDLFHVLYCSGSMCVGVTVWFGWGGVVSLCRLRH